MKRSNQSVQQYEYGGAATQSKGEGEYNLPEILELCGNATINGQEQQKQNRQQF